MSKREIFITRPDHARLSNLVGKANNGRGATNRYLDDLREELDRAIIVDATEIPPDVITMNTRLVFRDLTNGTRMTCTLVYPGEGDVEHGYVSILAPIGTALLGYRVGDTIEWEVPRGKTRITVEEILYQPEAAARLRDTQPSTTG